MKNLGPYQINNIYAGECSEMMKALPDACIDLTVTSPPYDNLRSYNGFTFNYEAVINQLYRVTKPGGVVVWVVADATINGSETGTSFRQALYGMSVGFNLHDTMIYEQAGTGAKGSNLAYWQSFEYMFIFSKGQPKTANLIYDKSNKYSGYSTSGKRHSKSKIIKSEPLRTIPEFSKRTNIWRYAGEPTQNHPAPFPEKLARDHIISWSKPGDLVLDPMTGSGRTCKAAMQNGRLFLGFDISPEYVSNAREYVMYSNPPLLVIG